MNRTPSLLARLAAPMLLMLATIASGPAAAQSAPDWSERPPRAPAPEFAPPEIERHTLSNGLDVWLVEKPGVPVAQIDLHVRVGSVDDGPNDGLARLTSDLMDEGAGDRDALQLADAVEFLGIGLSTSASLHTVSVRLSTPVSKLDEALALMADIALRPTFEQDDLDRVRTSRITALEQRRDEARSIAGVALAEAVYPDHPYARLGSGTPASLAAITRDDVADFHAEYVRPSDAALVVVGALDWDDVSDRVETAFGSDAWSAREDAPARLGIPEPTQVGGRRLVLVDKPGAAQSVLRIGRVGTVRTSPDYYALEVLNTILGGSFTSRLNQNLRERNGYSYGAGSSFTYRPVAGPFLAASDVQTDVTAPALTEFFRELAAIGERVPDGELAKARDFLALSFPSPFATVRGTAGAVRDLWFFGLSSEAMETYAEGVRSVTADDLERVAAEYVDPDAVVVVIVGDRAVIEDDVRALDLGPVEVRSVEDVLGPAPE
ncbi:MAG: pitrilysin family protein [Bacteroidota bacterium]